MIPNPKKCNAILAVAGFWCWQEQSAAILVVSLLVFEPSSKLMILTKANVAAQAFAEHIESFDLPEFVTSKIGRSVGFMELKRGAQAEKTVNWMWRGLSARMFPVLQPSCHVDQGSLAYPD